MTKKEETKNIARIAKAMPSHWAVLGCIGLTRLNWSIIVSSVVFWESSCSRVMELLFESNNWFVKFPIQIRVPDGTKYQI